MGGRGPEIGSEGWNPFVSSHPPQRRRGAEKTQRFSDLSDLGLLRSFEKASEFRKLLKCVFTHRVERGESRDRRAILQLSALSPRLCVSAVKTVHAPLRRDYGPP